MASDRKDLTVEEAAAEARRRVAEAAATGAKLLNLWDLPLAELPEELGALGGLEALALGDDYVIESGGEFSFEQGCGWGKQHPQGWKRERKLVLPDLAPLGGLKNLRRLSLSWLDVKDISALAELAALEWLDMRLCTATDVSALAGLSRLKYLNLSGRPKLKLTPLAGLTALEHLDLGGRPAKDLSALSQLPNLRQLRFATYSTVDVPSLRSLPHLKSLRMERCRLKDLTQFQGGFESLEELDLYGASVAELTGVDSLVNLRVLKLPGPKKLADLSPLASLTKLELLDLTMCKHVRDLTPLTKLPHLRTLILEETGVRDYSPLEQMKALKSLNVRDMPLRSLAPFATLRGLEAFNIGDCHNIKDISLLANMPDLRELDLTAMELDLAPLAKLQRLEKLNLYAARVKDLSPLRGLKRLRVLSLWSCHAETGVAVLAELPSLKELNLFGFSTSDPCPFETLAPLLDQLDVLRLAKSSAFPEFDNNVVIWFKHNHLKEIKAYVAARAPTATPVEPPSRKERAAKRAGAAAGAGAPPTGASRGEPAPAVRRPPVMPAGIREKLDWLSRSNPELWPFGASEHGFRLVPPLSEADLHRACETYAIELPEDFRRFLLEIGSGGAGPCYGLERFGFLTSKSLIPKGQPKGAMIEAVRDKRGRLVSQSDLFDEQGRKVEWFDVSFYRTIADLAGDGAHGPTAPARPFPLSGPLEAEDAEEEEGQARVFSTLSPADGVWSLAHYGCEMIANLVLNGPLRGQVWFYDPNAGSYEPFAERSYLHNEECPMDREKPDPAVFTFSEWYEHWLDYAYLQVWAASQGGRQ